MKRTLFVLTVAAMLIFAFAGSAFAAGVNHSGQTGSGLHGAPDANPAAVSTAAIYLGWSTTLGSNGVNGNSPHGNYTTTTVKCVVCHAVHYAGAGGATVASGNQNADTLLRMKASEACIMCHATSGMAVNGKPVYNGAGPLALDGPGKTGGAYNTGHIIGTNCTYCHTNVHGADADHSIASFEGYLLKTMPATDVQGTGAATNNVLEAMTAIDHNAVNQGFAPDTALPATLAAYAGTNNTTLREQAVGVFCAECHLGAYATGAAGAATNVYGSGTAAFSGHRIGAMATDTWNADGSISSGLIKGQKVAWAPANICKDCHDAQDNFGNAAFPHAWGSTAQPTKMWLLSGADAGAGKTGLGASASNPFDTSPVQLSDGVCLKCHVASGGTDGVGIKF